jgi:hypothetical protein
MANMYLAIGSCKDNFKAIKNLYGEIGFNLLLNNIHLSKKGDAKIALVGVENWNIISIEPEI